MSVRNPAATSETRARATPYIASEMHPMTNAGPRSRCRTKKTSSVPTMRMSGFTSLARGSRTCRRTAADGPIGSEISRSSSQRRLK